mgnify:CR=1 FL=1
MDKADIARGVSFATLWAGIFSFLGPVYHWSKVAGPNKAQSAGEGRFIGVIFGVVGIGLGFLAFRLFRGSTNKTELLWGKTGLLVSSTGLVFWIIVQALSP